MRNKLYFPFIALIALLSISCQREEPIFSNAAQLLFSADTVFLDTVFSTVGSSTYALKVFNPEDELVVIDRISLGRGASSAYRINVDGLAGKEFQNIEVLPNDSIYVFVEVSAPEINGADALYLDSIQFSNKGNSQWVQLVTLARDVYFHRPNRFLLLGNPPNQVALPYSILDCSQNWTNDKPHVVYGYGIIDTGCTLTLDPGTEVYFHNNSGLLVADFGELLVAPNGIVGLTDSVIFAGDRLEPAYENIPGQWGGILGGIYVAQRGKADINMATIKNASTAIRVDSAFAPNQLRIRNSYLLNHSRVGLYGGYGHVTVENSVLANCGLHLFYAFGGNYRFVQTTFANYWTGSTRNSSSVLLTNVIELSNGLEIVRDIESAYFGNCIITGNNAQEFSIAENPSGNLNYFFNHGLLKVDSDPEDRGYDVNDQSHFLNVLLNRDPDFVDIGTNFYDLGENSAAANQGNAVDGQVSGTDILGRIRNIGTTDLGAFERQN